MYKMYRRTNMAMMRPVEKKDIEAFDKFGRELRVLTDLTPVIVSISEPDLNNGSPKIGDMIAMNPKNPEDQWLVAEKYFQDNFEKA